MNAREFLLVSLVLTTGLGSIRGGQGGSPQDRPPAQPEIPPEAAPQGSFELLNSLAAQVLRANPSILAARKGWAAHDKRPSQLSSLPNPELTFGSMSTGNPLPYSTTGDGPLSWASFMFKQKIPWPGKLDLKGEIAQTEAQRAALDYRTVTLKVLGQLKKAYFDLHYLTRSEEILKDYRTLLDSFSRTAETRYSVGEGIQSDVLRSHVERSLLEERLQLIRQRRESARARINALLNRSPDAALPELPPIDGSPVGELPYSLQRAYRLAREQNPEIDAERVEIQKASLRLDLAKKGRWPDFSVSVGYMLRGGAFDNMYEYRAGLEIPLYFWRKERPAVEQNVEELAKARHEYRSKFQDITLEIKDSYIAAETSQRLIRLYREGIIPQAQATLDSALSAYKVGSADFLALVENALTVLNYEIEHQKQMRDYFQSLARLERLLDVVLIK